MTQKPGGSTFQTLARREDRQRRTRGRSGTAADLQEWSALRVAPERGVRGGRHPRHGQSAAAPVPALLSPLGGDEVRQGAAAVGARAAPTGAGTSPGSPAMRGGSPAATGPQPLDCSVRGWRRRQAYRCDSVCASRQGDTRGLTPGARGDQRGVACSTYGCDACMDGHHDEGSAHHLEIFLEVLWSSWSIRTCSWLPR